MNWLPDDHTHGTLVGRAWIPQAAGKPAGPSVVALRADGVFDLASHAPTMSGLLELPDPAAAVNAMAGRFIGDLAGITEGSIRILAPCDLQVIKASGVTFASSLLERVIEEQAKGDAAQAESIRSSVVKLLGGRWPA